MSSYYVVGRVIVERFPAEKDEKEGDLEVLEVQGFSDVLELDEAQEVRYSMYDEADVPKEPGTYVLLYAGSFYPYQDYWGEHDVDVEINWTQVRKLKDEKETPSEVEVLETLLGKEFRV